ncbi:PhzF family phenazine biosynthesis protein [Coralliovum pocilloporae]|uniref:PhzF family phenazine biosynthesis protein n=1 Tax=Coralliovum pocilloporae TaxID=3066369 RepID=UPI0033079A8C
MTIQRIAAFSLDDRGGNPAGVHIDKTLPTPEDMQQIAADVGYSETVFAAPDTDQKSWIVRYFSPEQEVPFCGHATIALGAALAMKEGGDTFHLQLSEADITVEGQEVGNTFQAALQSPPTRSTAVTDDLLNQALDLFHLTEDDLDARIPPAVMEAGARHLVLALQSRSRLAEMAYDLEYGRDVMNSHGLVTVALVHAETDQQFRVRNAFASGGVVEDPATGAAAAALGGYLRDLDWPHGGEFIIRQGEDMGMPSRLTVTLSDERGSSIRVSGAARVMNPHAE